MLQVILGFQYILTHSAYKESLELSLCGHTSLCGSRIIVFTHHCVHTYHNALCTLHQLTGGVNFTAEVLRSISRGI